MIGVTIGVYGIYPALARLAANCLGEMTGIDSIILSEKDLLKKKLHHPAALKLFLFELVKDENVIYFDADWFCTRPWAIMQHIDNTSIVSCMDFVMKNDWPDQYPQDQFPEAEEKNTPDISSSNGEVRLRKDYIKDIQKFSGIKTDPKKWINTGFFMINQSSHSKWLDTAKHLYFKKMGHHPEYYEQPAMNKAVESLNIKIKFLPRNLNVLVSTRTIWPTEVIGLHVKTKRHPIFVRDVMDGKIKSATHVRDFFISKS